LLVTGIVVQADELVMTAEAADRLSSALLSEWVMARREVWSAPPLSVR
jgi:hypothetical protein